MSSTLSLSNNERTRRRKTNVGFIYYFVFLLSLSLLSVGFICFIDLTVLLLLLLILILCMHWLSVECSCVITCWIHANKSERGSKFLCIKNEMKKSYLSTMIDCSCCREYGRGVRGKQISDTVVKKTISMENSKRDSRFSKNPFF